MIHILFYRVRIFMRGRIKNKIIITFQYFVTLIPTRRVLVGFHPQVDLFYPAKLK